MAAHFADVGHGAEGGQLQFFEDLIGVFEGVVQVFEQVGGAGGQDEADGRGQEDGVEAVGADGRIGQGRRLDHADGVDGAFVVLARRAA